MTIVGMLVAGTAWACGEAEACAEEPKEDSEVQITAAWVPLGGAGAARLLGSRDAWVGVEGRATSDGRWMGRGGLGFDVFGGSGFDLRLGVVAGAVGQARRYGGAALGSDVAIGATFDHLYGHLRWVEAFGGGQGPGWMHETETLVGWRVGGEVRVFGAFYTRGESACCRVGGLGVGADVRF